jgi:hypothetical protein
VILRFFVTSNPNRTARPRFDQFQRPTVPIHQDALAALLGRGRLDCAAEQINGIVQMLTFFPEVAPQIALFLQALWQRSDIEFFWFKRSAQFVGLERRDCSNRQGVSKGGWWGSQLDRKAGLTVYRTVNA